MITEAQREASVKFSNEIKPIEVVHEEALNKLKEVYNTVLFQVKPINLNNRLRKQLNELEMVIQNELRLTTRVIRNHYL